MPSDSPKLHPYQEQALDALRPTDGTLGTAAPGGMVRVIGVGADYTGNGEVNAGLKPHAALLVRLEVAYDDYKALAIDDRGSRLAATLRQAHAALASFLEWRPIREAPRDGTRIRVGRWMGDYGWITGTAVWMSAQGIEGWLSRGDGVYGELGLAHPTHYMSLVESLPQPPPAPLKAEA